MRPLARGAGLTAIVVSTITLLMSISGLLTYAAGATTYVLDRAPVWLQIEREMRLELKSPIPVEELPALVTKWGVRLDGFQHTYPAPHRPVTMGAAVPPGADALEAATRHRATATNWVDVRIARMVGLTGIVDATTRASLEENIHDLREIKLQIAAAGVTVSQVDVRAGQAVLQQILADPVVRRGTWR